MLWRYGADLIVSAKFYQAVFKAVLLFGAETGVLTAAKLQKLEGVHVSFLRQVAGMADLNLGVDTWQKEGADRVLQVTGTKPLREYIERRHTAVAEWVAL